MDAGISSLSRCSAGRFCLWSLINFQGSFRYKSGSAVTHRLTDTIRSIWNNRSASARL
ncbi:peptidase inhibitor family I36 protein [Nocardioides limicola]|uniref:peptidase inhibitor family I36 protein n=1 Tax=Nocardioides limicola TaxID=2803368 RepID=UPI0035580A11